MGWIDLVGLLGAALAAASAAMHTNIALRWVAIGANAVTLVYGLLAGSLPIALLGLAPLPFNVWRLIEMRRLTESVRRSAGGDLSMAWLLPYMTRRHVKKGEVLFRKDEIAREMFYVVRGRVEIPEIHAEVGAGSVIGEIGMFSPDKKRTATARCASDGELLVMDDARVEQLYAQNPDFGFHLIRLITSRLVANVYRLENAMGAVRAGRSPVEALNTPPSASPPL